MEEFKEYIVNYPICYHTVDCAVMREGWTSNLCVLLIQKPNEVSKNVWRFPGGFMDPGDNCAEDAATREVMEETGMTIKDKLEYIGSSKIDDTRYRDSPHKIITSFYLGHHVSGQAGQGFDDVAVTKWFDINDIMEFKVNQNPVHDVLFDLFRTFITEKY